MHFQTPPDVCAYMCSLLKPYDVETVLEPTPGVGNLVRALTGYAVAAPDDFWALPEDSKFDAVVMNPPFTPMVVGYDILFKCMEMAPVVIALMPWLTIINSERRSTALVDYGLKSITHLPRKAFKGSRVQTCILELAKGYSATCEFKLY